MQTQEDRLVLSISDITHNIKLLLENNFSNIWLEGEISNLRTPSSGHMYFTLKDENSQIMGVMFRSVASKLKFDLEDGLKVLVCGNITVYEKSGNYQINVRKMEPKGIGDLQLKFLQLKEKLEKEGLFDPARKKPIPLFPKKIGVVTSPTGAAIRDIINVLNRRFGNVHLIIHPAAVQGDNAKYDIVKGIETFNKMHEVDVIITGRGGGSIEDLWAFNEETVARAIFKSNIPIISAVGHEIDWTISDFVADLRVPTPSAAAELVIAKETELKERLHFLSGRMDQCITNKINFFKNRVEIAKQHYVFKEPQNMISQYRQRIDDLENNLTNRLSVYLEKQKDILKTYSLRLNDLNPLTILNRGYGVSFDKKTNKIVKDTNDLKIGQEVKTRLTKGSFISTVKEILE